MRHHVIWRLFLRVKNAEKAQRVIARVEEALGLKIEPTMLERYWNDAEFFDLRFRQSLKAKSAAEIVFEALTMAGLLAGPYRVAGPVALANGRVELNGEADDRWGTFHVPGVAWAHFGLPAEEES